MILGNILGPDALIIVVLALVLLFGAGRLPHLARSIGEASKEFKKAHEEAAGEGAAPSGTNENPPPPAAQGRVPPGPGEETITLTRAELEARLSEREAQTRGQAPPTA
jgi:sec-independent protein translocase protein TatA